MKEIIVNNNVINIEDIKKMEITPRLNFVGVRIWFKIGSFVDVKQSEPEQYIKEYFTN